jgi:RNA polymerase sigma-70 factor (ECF subfamily)
VLLRQTGTTLGVSAVSGDWQQLYEADATVLLRYLAKLTGDRELASEVMQETFVRAMRANPEFASARSAHAWLFRTATNLARNELRHRRIFAFVSFSGGEHAPHAAFDIEADQVRTALRSLPFDQAATLLLHYHSGFHVDEIAELQGISEETVKSRLARGRKNFMAAYRRLERGLRE